MHASRAILKSARCWQVSAGIPAGPREKKPRSRHDWLATPTPTRTTTPASTTPAATMHTVRGLALSFSLHILQAAAAFSRGAATHHPAAVHMGCARGAVHGGRRESASWQFSAIFLRRRCVRQGLAAAWAMLVDVLLLVAAAGSLRASLLVALLHLYLLR